MEKVSEELKEKAIKLGLCEQWTNEWEKEDKDSLCEKYVKSKEELKNIQHASCEVLASGQHSFRVGLFVV